MILILIVWLFIVGFTLEYMGLFEENSCTLFNKVLLVLFCMTVGIIMFPVVLGAKISKVLNK